MDVTRNNRFTQLPNFLRLCQHNPNGGLPLSFNSRHNILIRATDKSCFVCQLAIVKYFDRLTMWGEVWLEIRQISQWAYIYVKELQYIETTVYTVGSMITVLAILCDHSALNGVILYHFQVSSSLIHKRTSVFGSGMA